jgi:PKD repeat protein
VPPLADFSAGPLAGQAPLAVTFTDQSTGGPASWSWSFGDGATSNEQDPTHVYAEPGIFTVTLVASNAAGSSEITKARIVSVRWPSPVQTLLPVADALVNEASPSSNSGSGVELRVRFDDGGSYHSYVRFDLTHLAGTVRSARLRLFCTDPNDVGGTVFPTSSAWSETGITWANKPAAAGDQIASLGTVEEDTWYELDVSDSVAAGGSVSFLLTSTDSGSARYSSREGGNPPELVIETRQPVPPAAGYTGAPLPPVEPSLLDTDPTDWPR